MVETKTLIVAAVVLYVLWSMRTGAGDEDDAVVSPSALGAQKLIPDPPVILDRTKILPFQPITSGKRSLANRQSSFLPVPPKPSAVTPVPTPAPVPVPTASKAAEKAKAKQKAVKPMKPKAAAAKAATAVNNAVKPLKSWYGNGAFEIDTLDNKPPVQPGR